jgi:hypothetical protein
MVVGGVGVATDPQLNIPANRTVCRQYSMGRKRQSPFHDLKIEISAPHA